MQTSMGPRFPHFIRDCDIWVRFETVLKLFGERIARIIVSPPPAHGCVAAGDYAPLVNADSARSIAFANAAALFTVSMYSLAGTLSATMPAPA